MMYKNESNASSLAQLLLNYDYVMIDTSSLMEDSFPPFAEVLEAAKKHYFLGAEPIYVLGSSVAELKKHKVNKEKITKRIAAKRALRILRKLKWHKVVIVLKEGNNQNFADQAILGKAMADRTNRKILVITQDKKLADDLKSLNEQKAVHGKILSVFKIDPKGELVLNKGEEYVRNQKPVSEQAPQKFKPQKSPAEQKGPSPHQTHRPDPSELNNKVVAADKRLRSIMGNSNYPKEKKIADAKALLSDLSRLSPETIASLHLIYTPEKIQEAIEDLQNPKPGKTEPKPKATSQQAPAKKKDLWYEYGSTIEAAFSNVANHYGVIFRDPKISYVSSVHGPIDFVKSDLKKIATLFGEDLPLGKKIIHPFKGINLQAEKTQKGIKAWIDLTGVLTPEPKAEEAPKTPAPKAKVKEPSPSPKKEAKPEKKSAPKAAVSEQEKKPSKPVKKEEKPAKPSQNKKKEAPKDKAEKPKPEAKKAPEKKPSKKVEKQAETPKKEKAKEPAPKAKPAKKEATPKKSAPKKEPAKKAPANKPVKKPSHLEETIQFDERLKANINNPNYPKDQKIKDIEAQIERVKKVSAAERSKLNFNLDVLKTLLAMTEK